MDIIEKWNVGQVVLKIGEAAEKNNFGISRFARLTMLQYRQAKKYRENAMQKVDLDVLARICYACDCNISDILEYLPPKD